MTGRCAPRASPLCFALIAMVFAPSAHADEADAMHFVIGQDLTYDTNLFRLPSGASPPPALTGVDSTSRSDFVSSTHVGIQFDRTYSRQRLRADITLTHYAYLTYRTLDFNGIVGVAA